MPAMKKPLLCRLGLHTVERSQGEVGYCLREGCDHLLARVNNGRTWTRYVERPDPSKPRPCPPAPPPPPPARRVITATIGEIAVEHGGDAAAGLQILLSHAVDVARKLEPGSVDVNYHSLIRIYVEQIMGAVFESLPTGNEATSKATDPGITSNHGAQA